MRWAVQRACLDRVLVARNNRFKAVHTRVEDVTIQGKAVRRSLTVGWNRTTKTIERNLFVAVVELQNFADVSDCLKVLVAVRVEVVERVCLGRVAV